MNVPPSLRCAALALVALAACTLNPQREGERPLRVVVLSDLNSSYGSAEYEPEVAAAVALVTEEWRPDLVLIAGDMIAGQRPSLPDAQVRAMWTAFDSVVARPLRRAGIPFAFTLGNHDASGHPAHARDRRLAIEYWRERGLGVDFVDRERFPFSYAFRVRDAFFVVLDASTGAVAADSGQLAWLRRVLGREGAREADTRIALGHVPLYAVAEGRNSAGEVQAEPDSLRAILERGGIDMYVAGHHHAYYPGRRDSLLVLSAGALGQGPRRILGTNTEPFKTVTVLELLPTGAIADRTFRIQGEVVTQVDARVLPGRIDGVNGYVVRR